MASTAQAKEFIKKIAPVTQEAYKTLGKVFPSVCIAMACVECAYGTAESVKYHSYLGHKVGRGKTALTYWGGKSFNAKTKEEYTVGTHTLIRDNFRAFDSMKQCVFNFYELLNTSLYKGVKSGVDYKTQMSQIKAAGYMTSSTEVNSVISIINKYDLTKYDRVDGVNDTDSVIVKSNPYKEPQVNVTSKDQAKLKGVKTFINTGDGVKWLQWELNKQGANLVIDGKAGKNTVNAIILFQSATGLEPDGIAGVNTRNKLKAVGSNG